MAKCLRVPKSEGEPVRRGLIEDGLLDLEYRIGSDGDDLLIPCLCDEYKGMKAEEAELRPQNRGEGD